MSATSIVLLKAGGVVELCCCCIEKNREVIEEILPTAESTPQTKRRGVYKPSEADSSASSRFSDGNSTIEIREKVAEIIANLHVTGSSDVSQSTQVSRRSEPSALNLSVPTHQQADTEQVAAACLDDSSALPEDPDGKGVIGEAGPPKEGASTSEKKATAKTMSQLRQSLAAQLVDADQNSESLDPRDSDAMLPWCRKGCRRLESDEASSSTAPADESDSTKRSDSASSSSKLSSSADMSSDESPVRKSYCLRSKDAANE